MKPIKIDTLNELHTFEGTNTLFYLPKTQDSNTPIIVKLQRNKFLSSDALQEFENEYEITSHLNLPGIRRAIEKTTVNGKMALVLEYVEGVTLKTFFLEKNKDLIDILSSAISIVKTLSELHKNYIIHKNLNSDNIIINPENKEISIIDFSIASKSQSAKEQNSSSSIIKGSLPYISPEQTGRMNLPVDHRTDLYSFGVILYELITGSLPFKTTETSELLHCHIAKIPLSPCLVKPQIPQTLSNIVDKLLSKDPKDRYQTTFGLLSDLKKCLNQIKDHNKIIPFEIAKNDYTGILNTPKDCLGCNKEQTILHEAYYRIQQGRSEVILITGDAGVGKTFLINEFQKYITNSKGCFISGKHDIYQQNTPYHAITEAFKNFTEQLLIESSENIKLWRSVILEHIGSNGSMLINAIPEIELIIGSQPSISISGPHESQIRFNQTFLSFIKAIIKIQKSLVLFVDNFQWVDEPSKNLLNFIFSDTEIKNLLVIFAYIENENITKPPLQSIERQYIENTKINIKNLSIESLNILICDSIKSNQKDVGELTKLIFEKTEGNPLFSLQLLKLLYEENLLFFNFDTEKWNWISEKIREITIPDNVVRLMSQKINKLPSKTQELLSLASCIGNKFNIEEIAIVANIPSTDILEILEPSIERRLLIKQDNNSITNDKVQQQITNIWFEFIHNNIRQAANALIPRKRKKTLSLEIGRQLLKNTPKSEIRDRIFVLCNLFNEGFQYITDEDEKYKLSELNLLAGRKAKVTASYKSAIWYLSMGIGILPSGKWENYFDLTLSLYLESAEMEYLNGDFDRAKLLSDEILKYARDTQTKIKVYELRILFFTAQYQYESAINSGFEALKLLDHNIPDILQKIDLLEKELSQELLKKNNKITKLQHLPFLEDEQKSMIMFVLSSLVTPAFRIRHKLFPAIIIKMILISVKNGNSELSAHAYAWYAEYLCEKTNNIEAGYKFGELAVKMLSIFKSPDLEPKVLLIFNVFVKHWRNSIKMSLQPLQKVFISSIEVGNPDVSLYSAYHYSNYLFLSGVRLNIVNEICMEYNDKIQRCGLGSNNSIFKIWNLTIQILLSGGSASQVQDSNVIKKIPKWLNQNYLFPVFSTYFCQTIINFTNEDYTKSIETASLAEQYQKGSESYFYIVCFKFYYALSLLANFTHVDNDTQEEYLSLINIIVSLFEKWSYYSPENCSNKLALIKAELSRIKGDNMNAIKYYGIAIKEAKEQGYLNEEAIAYECEAKFYLSIDREDIGSICIQKAFEAYTFWGAQKKCALIKDKYKLFLKKTQSVDTSAVINASLALSQELRLEQLLNKLMHIVIENAGAEKGILIENQNDTLKIQAKGETSPDEITTMMELPVEESADLPLSVINYVARTNNPIILDNAFRDSSYNTDNHIITHKVKSLLCLPIMHQGTLMGILYVENNLSTGVFTMQRLELLRTLVAQAAISMVNARLYTDLEQKVIEIKKAEEALINSQKRYQSLFEDSPISLWEEDFSAGKLFFDKLKESGVTNFREYFKTHPEAVMHCNQLMKVTDINKTTLALTQAKNKEELLSHLNKVFINETFNIYREEIIALAEGKTKFEGEAITGTLVNKKLTVLVQMRVVPGYEDSLGKILVSIQDITSRKKSEELLQLNANRLSTLLKLNQMQDASLDEITKFAHEESIKLTKSKYGYLAFLNEDEDILTMNIWSKNAMKECEITDKPFVYPLNTTGLWGEAVRQRKPIITNDYNAPNPLKKGYPKGHVHLTRHMNVPVFADSKIVLIAGVGNKETNYDETDVKQLTLLMEGMWRIIESIKAKEKIYNLNQELEKRVSDRTLQLEEANKELEAFSYSVSHDLRAPLRHINGFLELLKRQTTSTMDAKGLHYLDNISDASKRMDLLINDLLDFSRMGRKDMSKREVDIAGIVQDVIQEFKLDISDRDIQWQIAQLPKVIGDSSLLRSVMVNLISNAIKYTRTRQKAVIEIGFEKNDSEVIIFVADNGIGFDPNHADKIFGVFQRLHTSNEFEGTGVGLANVKRIITRHNGRVWAKGQVEKGATFYFSLPTNNIIQE